MAGQQATAGAAIPATASIVGNAFVIQYYNVLHQSPHVVHRFYTDESRLSRAEAWPNTMVDTAATMSGIHEKVMSLDYGGVRAEIKTVDSQESLTGSVLVMVTGSLSSASRVKRNFVQTFFLAPQEKGYFVLNDVFRYLDGDERDSQPASPVASGILEPPAAENTVSDQGVMEPAVGQDTTLTLEYSPSEAQEEVPAEVPYELLNQAEVSEAEEEAVVENVVNEQQEIPESKHSEPETAGEEAFEEAPKKSYASILRVRKDGPGAPVPATQPAIPKAVPAQVERSTPSSSQPVQAAPQLSTGASSPRDHMDESSALENEGDSRSVYVKNLPLNVTAAELEEEFLKFGQLKPGGVNLRNQRPGVCFAFVEFEEVSSAQRATEASPISMGGRQVYVEEKRPMPSRGGRGRFNQGRAYQNEGMRGRGYFNGRGAGRGGQDSDKDFGRGRGAATGHSGYNGNAYASNGSVPSLNYVNGYRRFDSQNGNSQNGNGVRPARRGAGNQMGRNGPAARNGLAVAAA